MRTIETGSTKEGNVATDDALMTAVFETAESFRPAPAPPPVPVEPPAVEEKLYPPPLDEESEAAEPASSSARRDALYRRSLAVSDGLAAVTALFVGLMASNADPTWGALFVIPGVVALAKVLGLYDRDEVRLHKETLGEVPTLFSLATLATLIAYLGEDMITSGGFERLGVFLGWIVLAGALVFGRALVRGILRSAASTERCLVVGDVLTAKMFARKLAVQGLNAEVVGALTDTPDQEPEWSDDLIRRLKDDCVTHRIDRVVLASSDWRPDDVLHTISELKAFGVRVSVLPPISRVATLSFEIDQLPGIAVLGMRGFGISRSSRMVKRAFDASAAGIALVALSPLLLAIAVAIKADSRGPVLFRQRRIGRRGRPFYVLKFRSMVEDADDRKADLVHLNESDGFFKITDDPRITRVGRVLRKYSLDELPQLFNVVRGEMSLVGPRPLIPEEDRMIEGAYRRRLEVPPGMTGHWQILGSWRVPRDEMATLDYIYYANWSLWRDIKLLVQTVPYVLRRNNT